MINIVLVLNFLFQISVSSVVLIKNRKSATNFLFTINAYLLASWSLTFVLKNIVTTNSQILIITRIMLLFPLLYSFSFFEFARTFPNKKYKINVKIIIPIVSFIIISIVLLPTRYFISSATRISDFVNYEYGVLYSVYGIYTLLLSMSGVLILYIKLSKSEGIVRKQLQYTLIGIFLTAITSLILNVFLPLANNNSFIDIGACAPIFYISLFAYAILKHELMDIRLAITRTVSYGLVITGIFLSFITVYYGLDSYPIIQLIGILLLATFWAFTAIPLSNFLVTTAKRKFIRGFYESDKVLIKLSEKLSEETDRQTIIKNVEDALYEAFELERTSIILAVRDENNVLSHYMLIDEETQVSMQLEKDNDLIKYFNNKPNFELFDLMERDLQSLLIKIGYKPKEQCILLPLLSPEILEGIIILGKRSSQKPYSQKDFDFIKQIKTFVSAILYKLTPYEKIEKKFLANQKKLHDAEVQILRSKKNESVGHLHRQFSHELRTPLNCIMHLTESLKTQPEDESIKQDIYEEINNALDIVKETLRLSKTDDEEARIETMMDVNDAITGCLKLMPASGYEVKQELSPLPQTLGVYRDLQMVFTNLMSNARDAMPDGGIVTIRTYTKSGDIYIEFSDTGRGIPDEMKAKVWQPYISGNQTDFGNDTGGRGWGLTIVNRIIEEHQGYISFVSEEGTGTTFTIRLPIRAE